MNRFFSREFVPSDKAVLVYLAFATLLIHFLTISQYGYFRDEFYYMACGEHLSWGGIDHPPLVDLIVHIHRRVLGDSLFALRFLPAVCGALVVLLSGLMARELGGGRFAQILAALAVLVAPVYLGTGSDFSMNCFDHLFWVLGGYTVIRILKEDRPRLWLLFGLLAGIGLMNKYSMGFFGLGLVVGLALTPARKYFGSKWLWLGGAIASVISLPHVLWEIRHSLPNLEFIRNATRYKNVAFSPPDYLLAQIVQLDPFTFPIWAAGLYFFFAAKEGKPYRPLGWIYVTVLGLFLLNRAKPYYLSPAYFTLFAGGALAIEAFVRRRGWNWLKPVSIALLVVSGAVMAPFAMPVLPVETFIKYQDFLGVKPGSDERTRLGKLPQHYADMFGWENLVATAAKVYNSLSPEEKAECVVGGSNYGEAGAIDFFGKKYGLPNAISSHNSYWVWGPGEKSGEVLLVVGGDLKDYQSMYEQVDQVATVVSQYARPSETDLPVYLCRRPKMTLQEVWPRIKHFI